MSLIASLLVLARFWAEFVNSARESRRYLLSSATSSARSLIQKYILCAFIPVRNPGAPPRIKPPLAPNWLDSYVKSSLSLSLSFFSLLRSLSVSAPFASASFLVLLRSSSSFSCSTLTYSAL